MKPYMTANRRTNEIPIRSTLRTRHHGRLHVRLISYILSAFGSKNFFRQGSFIESFYIGLTVFGLFFIFFNTLRTFSGSLYDWTLHFKDFREITTREALVHFATNAFDTGHFGYMERRETGQG